VINQYPRPRFKTKRLKRPISMQRENTTRRTDVNEAKPEEGGGKPEPSKTKPEAIHNSALSAKM
jgi:hypothetical protein